MSTTDPLTSSNPAVAPIPNIENLDTADLTHETTKTFPIGTIVYLKSHPQLCGKVTEIGPHRVKIYWLNNTIAYKDIVQYQDTHISTIGKLTERRDLLQRELQLMEAANLLLTDTA